MAQRSGLGIPLFSQALGVRTQLKLGNWKHEALSQLDSLYTSYGLLYIHHSYRIIIFNIIQSKLIIHITPEVNEVTYDIRNHDTYK